MWSILSLWLMPVFVLTSRVTRQSILAVLILPLANPRALAFFLKGQTPRGGDT